MNALPSALAILVRRPVIALLAALALALAFVLGALALWSRAEATRVADGFGDALVVSATLDPTLDAAATQKVLDRIEALPEIKLVRYVTPTQERERLAQRVGAELLAGLDDAALPTPPTVDITLSRGALSDAGLAKIEATLKSIQDIVGVQTIPWRPDALRLVLRFGDFAWLAGLILALGALAVAAGAVHHLARSALADVRDERALRAAFGATDAQLNLPSYVATLVLGGAGVAIALVLATWIDGFAWAFANLLPGPAGEGASGLVGPLFLAAALVTAALVALGATRLAIQRAPA